MNVFDLLSPWIPQAWSPRFWTTYFSLTPLIGATFQLARLSGLLRETGEPASLLVASRSTVFRSYLEKRFFANNATTTHLPPLHWWNLRQHLNVAAATTDDLVFCEAGRFLASRVLNSDFLYCPAWVGLRAEVPDDPAVLKKRLARVDGDLHLVRRNQLTATLDPDLSHVEDFYQNYYQPTIHTRHGEDSIALNLSNLIEGPGTKLLGWIHAPEGPIAGFIVKSVGSKLIFTAIGLRDGSTDHLKRGAFAACYRNVLQIAQSRKCTTIDYRGCRASLTDGVLAYKRKWGAALYTAPDLAYMDIALHWSRPSPALNHLFQHYAPIFRHNNALLSASVGPKKTPSRIETPSRTSSRPASRIARPTPASLPLDVPHANRQQKMPGLIARRHFLQPAKFIEHVAIPLRRQQPIRPAILRAGNRQHPRLMHHRTKFSYLPAALSQHIAKLCRPKRLAIFIRRQPHRAQPAIGQPIPSRHQRVAPVVEGDQQLPAWTSNPRQLRQALSDFPCRGKVIQRRERNHRVKTSIPERLPLHWRLHPTQTTYPSPLRRLAQCWNRKILNHYLLKPLHQRISNLAAPDFLKRIRLQHTSATAEILPNPPRILFPRIRKPGFLIRHQHFIGQMGFPVHLLPLRRGLAN